MQRIIVHGFNFGKIIKKFNLNGLNSSDMGAQERQFAKTVGILPASKNILEFWFNFRHLVYTFQSVASQVGRRYAS